MRLQVVLIQAPVKMGNLSQKESIPLVRKRVAVIRALIVITAVPPASTRVIAVPVSIAVLLSAAAPRRLIPVVAKPK